MRSEIRNQRLMSLIALSLVLMVIAVQVRLFFAADLVTPVNPRSPFQVYTDDGTPVEVTGSFGSIHTRDGELVFDGMNTKYTIFLNTVGSVRNEVHLSQGTLAFNYREALTPETLSVMSGLHNFKPNSGVQMTTTLLPGPVQQAIYDSFGEYYGAIYAYNYVTGETYCMLSVPSSAEKEPDDDGHFENRVRANFTPGSTMKIVTLVCALTQDPSLKEHTYTCSGSHKTPNGNEITCGSPHGKLTMTQAVGKSCNCYFASLIEKLDVDKTCDILDGLGIDSLGKERTGYIGEISYSKGFAKFVNNTSGQHIWKLIGQGSEVNLIDMARMAGAIANGGSSAVPYLVENIYDPNDEIYTQTTPEPELEELVSPDVAAMLKPIWAQAVEENYKKLDSRITLAKTGTAEYKDENGEKYHNRLLLGVVEEYNTAFMLVVVGLPAGNSLIMDIGNTLVQALDAADLS